MCMFVVCQEQQYTWDDGIHPKSSQAQNYKNQARFATIKSASLVRFSFFHENDLCQCGLATELHAEKGLQNKFPYNLCEDS